MVNIFLSIFIFVHTNTLTTGKNGVEISFSMDRVSRQDFSFPDAVWLNRAGEPNLPSLVYKIGIPQNGDVEVTILKNSEEVIKNMIIDPVIYTGIYEPPVPEEIKIYGAVYQKNNLFPDNLVEVSKPGYYRDIYTVEVRVNPLRYNPVTKDLHISRDIKINVRFKGKPKAKPILDTSFEEIYKRVIANYEQCKRWRREPKRDGRNPFESGVWYKIEVDEEGLYKIGYDEIKEVGLDPAQFDPQTMKIYTAAFDLLPRNVVDPFADSLVEVPVYVEGEDDHSFDKNDYLIFYGFPASHFVPDSTISWFENGYARNNVYWFTFGSDNGKRMERINAAWNGTTPDTLVNEILHIEEDRGNPTRSGINWYWQDISPGAGYLGSGEFLIDHPGASGNAEITVGFFTLQAGRFLYELYLGSDRYFSDTLYLTTHDRCPPHYITGNAMVFGDSSKLTMNILRPSGTGVALTAFFNSIDVQYERVTDINKPFHSFYSTAADYSIKCTDIGSTPFVLDITDLKTPKMFSNYTMDNNALILSSSSDSFQLLYFSKLSLTKSAELVQSNPGNLREPSPGCEYLFITHRDFYHAITPLVDHRRKEYSTRVVIVDDIYDDFSYGKYDPLAIKHFLYYAYNNWPTVPTFVLLVGDATYDYKNNLGKDNPPNFIPMYEMYTILSGNAGIPDNYIYEGEYVNFGAGEVMVLGRITVRTRTEVKDFIDKLFTYEKKNIDGMWNKRIILAGDDEWSNTYHWEGPGVHCGACEEIISFIPDSVYDITKVYMVSYPPFAYPCKKPNAQEAYIRELSKGGYAGVFYGHGNTHQLADEGLFYDTNIPCVKNSRKYFFYYYGSCTVGRFDDSGYECIGEQMVRIREGAIGTMAHTSGSGSWMNKTIGDTLFKYLTTSDLTMGECFHIAKKDKYLLLGDPATKLRRITDEMMVSATPDSLRPMEKLKVTTNENRYYLKALVRDTTHIEKIDVTTADKISGHVRRAVKKGPNPADTVIFDYKIDGKEIYQGFWDTDTATIIVPRVLTTHEPIVKVSSFIYQKSGMLDSIRVYGSAAPTSDNDGPEVIFYEGARKLKDGDWVEKEFVLTGKVSDTSGINLMNSVEDTRGFYLYINDDLDNKIDLRDYFIYDRNSYTSGEFNVALVLPEAEDTITINVADNYYNQTTKKLALNAEIYNRVRIENFLIYPNPLQGKGGIWFTFTLTNSCVMDIKIFTIAGRLIKSRENIPCQAGYNQVFWNTLDNYHDEISNGVYLVKALVRIDNESDEVIEKFIIAR
jgi:hypothetical protein